MNPMRVGIVNVTGYAGIEVARLLAGHPQAELVQVTGRSAAGQRLAQVFPHMASVDMPIAAELTEKVDVAFLALPHRASAEAALPLLEAGVKVIDLSADFRLKDAQTYQQWYEHEHPAPGLLPEAIYGLPELYREQIKEARLVANPGCYPTSAILGLTPALGVITDDIIVDSKSGVSGAGRSLGLTYHFSEEHDNVLAYGLGGHRHMPEIKQELEFARQRLLGEPQPRPLRLTFVPHLIPMTRGILSTAYAPLARSVSQAEMRGLYEDFYAGERFVRVVETPPQTKQTWGSNACLVYPTVDPRTERLVVVSCLDNLVKGAAGQAVQCMNLMCGLPEAAGLTPLGLYP
ncbi:MAG: N-acetyl-gamma-glutamyl-phosphate reductase [Chloroflexota bacterium]